MPTQVFSDGLWLSSPLWVYSGITRSKILCGNWIEKWLAVHIQHSNQVLLKSQNQNTMADKTDRTRHTLIHTLNTHRPSEMHQCIHACALSNLHTHVHARMHACEQRQMHPPSAPSRHTHTNTDPVHTRSDCFRKHHRGVHLFLRSRTCTLQDLYPPVDCSISAEAGPPTAAGQGR